MSGFIGNIGGGGGADSLSLPISIPYVCCSGHQSTDSTSFTGIGAVVFDPSIIFPSVDGTLTINFVAILEVSDAAVTATVQLYNLTTGEVLSNSILTSTIAAATSPEVITSSNFTIGASPNLVNDEQLYELQLKMTGGGESDLVICKYAKIDVLLA